MGWFSRARSAVNRAVSKAKATVTRTTSKARSSVKATVSKAKATVRRKTSRTKSSVSRAKSTVKAAVSKVSKAYSKLDTKVGGVLPGGVKVDVQKIKSVAKATAGKISSEYTKADARVGGVLPGGAKNQVVATIVSGAGRYDKVKEVYSKYKEVDKRVGGVLPYGTKVDYKGAYETVDTKIFAGILPGGVESAKQILEKAGKEYQDKIPGIESSQESAYKAEQKVKNWNKNIQGEYFIGTDKEFEEYKKDHIVLIREDKLLKEKIDTANKDYQKAEKRADKVDPTYMTQFGKDSEQAQFDKWAASGKPKTKFEIETYLAEKNLGPYGKRVLVYAGGSYVLSYAFATGLTLLPEGATTYAGIAMFSALAVAGTIKAKEAIMLSNAEDLAELKLKIKKNGGPLNNLKTDEKKYQEILWKEIKGTEQTKLRKELTDARFKQALFEIDLVTTEVPAIAGAVKGWKPGTKAGKWIEKNKQYIRMKDYFKGKGKGKTKEYDMLLEKRSGKHYISYERLKDPSKKIKGTRKDQKIREQVTKEYNSWQKDLKLAENNPKWKKVEIPHYVETINPKTGKARTIKIVEEYYSPKDQKLRPIPIRARYLYHTSKDGLKHYVYKLNRKSKNDFPYELNKRLIIERAGIGKEGQIHYTSKNGKIDIELPIKKIDPLKYYTKKYGKSIGKTKTGNLIFKTKEGLQIEVYREKGGLWKERLFKYKGKEFEFSRIERKSNVYGKAKKRTEEISKRIDTLPKGSKTSGRSETITLTRTKAKTKQRTKQELDWNKVNPTRLLVELRKLNKLESKSIYSLKQRQRTRYRQNPYIATQISALKMDLRQRRVLMNALEYGIKKDTKIKTRDKIMTLTEIERKLKTKMMVGTTTKTKTRELVLQRARAEIINRRIPIGIPIPSIARGRNEGLQSGRITGGMLVQDPWKRWAGKAKHKYAKNYELLKRMKGFYG